MINSFRDEATLIIFLGFGPKGFPGDVLKTARRKLELLESAKRLEDLKSPGNQLERLKEERQGEWSIRINRQWRICFKWERVASVV
jgi:proteic killer suppression protein